MKKSINIKNIRQKQTTEGVKIFFTIEIKDKTYTLWYDISSQDRQISKIEKRIDGIVVTFLLFAMWNKLDIESKYPISEKLYYNLTRHIIPKISNDDLSGKSHKIKINAPISNKQFKSYHWVGTGISCGVDSLTTIYEYTKICKIKNYQLTHLIHMKTGAHDGQIGRADKDTENKIFKEQIKVARKFCKDNGFPLIIIDSNLNLILSDIFGFTGYERTHTFRSCGTMLLLQNFFSKYYYASSGIPDTFEINTNFDCALYERWFIPLLSSDSLDYYSANSGMMRIEKTKALTKYKPSYDSLLVCWYGGKNCNECDKCIRTLITLDILGALYLYKNVFYINKYKKNKQKYFQRLYDRKECDHAFLDIYNYIEKNQILIPELESIKNKESEAKERIDIKNKSKSLNRIINHLAKHKVMNNKV